MKLIDLNIKYEHEVRPILKGVYLGFTNDEGMDEILEEGPFSVWEIKRLQSQLPKGGVKFFKVPISDWARVNHFLMTKRYA